MKQINIKNIPLFENIGIIEIENIHFDLHNDYNFVELILDENRLEMIFKKNSDFTIFFRLLFKNVELSKISIKQLTDFDEITLDNLYRGRFDKNGDLIETNELNKSYFYLDFVENIQIEFWALNMFYELNSDQ